jgi:fucose permease
VYDSRIRLFASAMAGQFLFGITLALFGTLFGIPAFTDALGLALGTQANVLVALYSGHLLFTAAVGRLVDRFGALRMLAAGAALLSAALALAALAGSGTHAIAAAAVMSLGGAAMNAGSNVLVSNAYGDERGSMLNIVALFGALGAISVPFVFAGAESIEAVRVRLFALASFGVLTGIGHLAQRQPRAAAHADEVRPSTRAILADGWIVALVVLLAIDFGLESIAAGWFSTYTLSAFPGGPATLMVGIYWTGLMVGRLLGPTLHRRIPKLSILAGAGFVVSIAFAGVSAAPSVAVLGVVVALAGLALGPIGPTVLSVAGARYSRGTGAVFGVLLSLGQVGSITLPWTVAQVAGAAGFRVAMMVASGSALVLGALAAVLWARGGVTGYLRREPADQA